MKCSKTDCGKDLPAGTKFCGDCGGAAAEVMAKCVGCTKDQPSGNKFCAECGETLAKTADAAEYESYMQQLEGLAQTNADLPAGVEPGKIEGKTVAEVLGKAAAGKTVDGKPAGEGKEGDGAVDALPFLEELLGGSASASAMLKAIGAEIRQVRKDQGLLAGAELVRMRKQKELGEDVRLLKAEVESWGNRGTGRRAIVNTHDKRSDKENPVEDKSPRGPELMAKAAAAVRQKKLEGKDLVRLETLTNRGHSLNEIIAAPGFEDLGTRVSDAIAAVTH